MSRILVTKEIADRLRCSNQTVLRMFHRGELPGAFKLGGSGAPVRISEAKLCRVIAKMEKEGMGWKNG